MREVSWRVVSSGADTATIDLDDDEYIHRIEFRKGGGFIAFVIRDVGP